LIIEAVQGLHSKRHVLSVDEKTGIQALARLEPMFQGEIDLKFFINKY
jgi:hypothetical protein